MHTLIQTRKPCWQVALKGIFGGGFTVSGGIMSGNVLAITGGAITYVDAVITMARGDCY